MLVDAETFFAPVVVFLLAVVEDCSTVEVFLPLEDLVADVAFLETVFLAVVAFFELDLETFEVELFFVTFASTFSSSAISLLFFYSYLGILFCIIKAIY